MNENKEDEEEHLHDEIILRQWRKHRRKMRYADFSFPFSVTFNEDHREKIEQIFKKNLFSN